MNAQNNWKILDDGKYEMQELALNDLFKRYPKNTNLKEVLLKVAVLNDFYSTNIFSVYKVAKHICSVPDVDKRLKEGDVSLVTEIQKVKFSKKKTGEIEEKNFYSFATKYCSHHNPEKYPIYDRNVDRMLRYYRTKDKFAVFFNANLKNYQAFKELVLKLKAFYKLEQISFKELDRFLWLVGKNII